MDNPFLISIKVTQGKQSAWWWSTASVTFFFVNESTVPMVPKVLGVQLHLIEVGLVVPAGKHHNASA